MSVAGHEEVWLLDEGKPEVFQGESRREEDGPRCAGPSGPSASLGTREDFTPVMANCSGLTQNLSNLLTTPPYWQQCKERAAPLTELLAKNFSLNLISLLKFLFHQIMVLQFRSGHSRFFH